MTDRLSLERWAEIEYVVDQALELAEDQRPALVERLCAGDTVLQREVARLLGAIEDSGGFLAESVSSRLITGAFEPEVLAPGTTLGPYELAGRLGRGATATVYHARDPKHHRSVAIKVVHPELSAALGADRFLREIEIAATLQHPHIVPLFDSGAVDGLLYYVMPHIEGQSLRQRLARGDPLPLGETIRIAQEVAGALDYAHRRGVVHRDIKPENILLQDGQAIVADFGIARAINVAGSDGMTHPGRATGTPAYMSPEQASNTGTIDGRTDVYSLGCVVYEMIAGQPPFTGDSAKQVLERHAQHSVPSLQMPRRTISTELERVLQRALAKSPGARYPTAQSFAEALVASTSGKSAAREWRRAALGAGVALSLVLVGGGFWLSRERSSSSVPAHTVAATGRLAVLPFDNQGDSADAPFAEGMTEAVRGKLATLPGLQVIASASSDQYRHTAKRPDQIGRELGVAYLLTGTVRSVRTPGEPTRLVIRARLVDAVTGAEQWGPPFETAMAEVFQSQSELAAWVAEALGLSLDPSERTRPAGRATRSLAAYSLYLQARAFWNQRTPIGLQDAARYFELATRQDSEYAEAYAGLAMTYELFPEYGVSPASEALPRARTAAMRALSLDSTLGQPHVVLADQRAYFEWDWRGAEREYRHAIALNPSDATAHHWYAVYLSTWPERLNEALTEIELAKGLDPLSRSINSDYGRILYVSRRYDEAIKQFRRTLDLDPDFAPAHDWLGLTYLAQGGNDTGVTEVEAAVRLTGRQAYVGDLAYAYAVSGQHTRALGALQELTKLSRRRYISPHEFAVAHTGLRDKDQAFAWLQRATDARLSVVAVLQVDPIFEPLRADPRFLQLLKRAKLR